MSATEIVLIVIGVAVFLLGYLMPARKKDMDEEVQLISEDEVRKLIAGEEEHFAIGILTLFLLPCPSAIAMILITPFIFGVKFTLMVLRLLSLVDSLNLFFNLSGHLLPKIRLFYHSFGIFIMLNCRKILSSGDLSMQFYKSYCHFNPPPLRD